MSAVGGEGGAGGKGAGVRSSRRRMRFGYWLPVFGGWLRNVEDEGMEASWSYVQRLARRSEEIGFDLTLIAELNLNDIKGPEAPSLDAWTTAAALAAVTHRLEIMPAVRPTFHQPALLAKQAANVDRISGGRLSLNLVASWWAEEARQYGATFDRHDERYQRAEEWLDVVDGMWSRDELTYRGEYFIVEGAVLEPKPARRPRPTVYAGGESRAGKSLISRKADGYLMHGGPPEEIAEKVEEMRGLRRELAPKRPPLLFGAAAFAVCRPTDAGVRKELERITDVRRSARSYANYREWVENTEMDREVSLEDYSVSNRGLRAGLTGTPEEVAAGVLALGDAGLDLLLLQMSPQLEEMERFAEEVIPLVREMESAREAAA